MIRTTRGLFVLAILLYFALQPALASESPSLKLMVPMRDGVRLATDVYLPEGEGPWPVLLTRTPYGKEHCIRLEIASSNFPCYDRNPNNGEPLFSSTRFVSARQTVYHDHEHPSRLILNLMSDPEM